MLVFSSIADLFRGSCLLSLLVFAAGFDSSVQAAQIGKSVSVNGHRLFYQMSGRGTPVVIIDVGIGETFRTWTPVLAEIAKTTSVLVYDRAGYGQSEAGPLPRDGKTEAAELKALLTAEKIPGPFVLVGHSLGAVNMQIFASEYPVNTAGMLLIDPPPREWLAGLSFPKLRDLFVQSAQDMILAAKKAENSRDAAERTQAAFLRTIASEQKEMLEGTFRSLQSIASFGGLRMIVIAAGQPNPAFGEDAGAFQKFWVEANRKLSRMSSVGEFVFAERSRHHVHLDAPEIVLDAIRKLISWK